MPTLFLLLGSATGLALQAGLFALLLALSALFSAAEASLVSTPAYYRRHLVPTPDGRGAAETERRLGPPNRVFVTVLVGNYLTNVTAAAMAASIALTGFSGPVWLRLLVAIIVAVFLLLTLGELFPRALATVDPDRTARSVTGMLAVVQWIIFPAVWFFERFSATALKMLGAPLQRRVFLDEEELKHMVEVGQAQGIIEKEEKEMISAVIDFADVSTGDVMVPRTDVVALEASASVDEMAGTVTESGYSRIPVYREDLDDILGVVYGKDVLSAAREGRDETAAALIKEALFVPETAPLDEVLREMKTRRIHIAIVHDEFGGTAGLVTLEDVLEEIVGDIFDEYDLDAEPLEWLSEERVLLDARMDVEEVNAALGTDLPEDEGYETLGGFLFHQLGRPGSAGETLEVDGVSFTLDRVDNRRILTVEADLSRLTAEATEATVDDEEWE